MDTYLCQQTETETKGLCSKELPAHAFKTVSSPLAVQILEELAKEPHYPKELARKLRIHEQKIYYHIRRMYRAGFLKVVKRETRAGALASYYAPSRPSFSLRIQEYEQMTRLAAWQNTFLEPFIENGALQALIIVGSPDPHGPERARSRDGYYGIDLALFLGTHLMHIRQSAVKLDTDVRTEDLQKNLILIGGPVVNKIVEKVNGKLPLFFNKGLDWEICSKLSGKKYLADEAGIIVRIKSPFSREKQILVVAGKRHQGTKAAILSFLQKKELLTGNRFNKSIFAHVVEGIDLDGDGVVDAAEVRE